jgi:hypothetical protein
MLPYGFRAQQKITARRGRRSPAAQDRRLVHFQQHGAVCVACRVLSTFLPGRSRAPGRFYSPDVPAPRYWLTACVSSLDKPALA